MRSLVGVMWDVVAEAWREMWRARLRTVLAVVGIGLGAAALVFMASVYLVTAGAWAEAHQQDWVTVSTFFLSSGGVLERRPRLRRDHLTLADADALRRASAFVERVVVLGDTGVADCKAGRRHSPAWLLGTDAARMAGLGGYWESGKLAWGRMFTPDEIARGERVAVLSYKARRDLFGRDSLENAFMRVGGVKFRVIGVSEMGGPKRSLSTPQVLIPYTCLQDLYGNVQWSFNVLPKRGARAEAVRSIDEILRQRLGDPGDSFVYWDGKPSAADLRGVAYLGLIGFLTMLSAGLAASNKMYIGVLERVDQIGLRRALGATAQRVYITVLLEGVLLCGLGSALGGGAGVLGFRALTAYNPPSQHGLHAPVQASLVPWLAMLLFAATLGVVAALQAAAVAVKATPAEALARKELV